MPTAPATEATVAAILAEVRQLTPAAQVQLLDALRRQPNAHAPLVGTPGAVLLAALAALAADQSLFDEIAALVDAEFGPIDPRDWMDGGAVDRSIVPCS